MHAELFCMCFREKYKAGRIYPKSAYTPKWISKYYNMQLQEHTAI